MTAHDFWEDGICYEDAVSLPDYPAGLRGTGKVTVQFIAPLLISRLNLTGVLHGVTVTLKAIDGTERVSNVPSTEDGWDSGEFSPVMATGIDIAVHRPSVIREVVALKTGEKKFLQPELLPNHEQVVADEVSVLTDLTGDPKSVMADWKLGHLIKDAKIKPTDFDRVDLYSHFSLPPAPLMDRGDMWEAGICHDLEGFLGFGTGNWISTMAGLAWTTVTNTSLTVTGTTYITGTCTLTTSTGYGW